MFKHPLFQLILVEVREFYREPGVVFWSLVFPILMAWGLGIAFSSKIEPTKTVAIVLSETSSAELTDRIPQLSHFNFSTDTLTGNVFYMANFGDSLMGLTHYILKPVEWTDAELMLKRGNVSLIITENNGQLNFHYDKQNSEAQLVYLHLSAIANGRVASNTQHEIKPITAKGSRYIDFLVPGLLAMNIMMSTMWGISYTLIEARTKKLLRRMVATPLRKWHYIASLFIARVFLCSVEAAIVFAFAHYYFDITISGSIIAFIALFISGIVAFTGIAVLVGSRTAKTRIGNGLINFVVMPMMLLSGIYFSYHNFPEFTIPYIQALPLTMLADGIKAIFNEGAELLNVGYLVLLLNGLGIFMFTLGMRIFKWY